MSASPMVNPAMSEAICMICSWYTMIPYVSCVNFSIAGCSNVILDRPCLRWMKSGISSMGPGR